jgi:hypothetical protein
MWYNIARSGQAGQRGLWLDGSTMAKQRSNGNGVWRTIGLMALSALAPLSVMTLYYGEQIGGMRADIRNIMKAVDRFDQHIMNDFKGTN